ncbi:thioredoxin [[Eubacterium] cylindroides ATCC 27803]|jgi:thioredoxin 1|nr:thioredoxin [[Eubacterium] cylindroides ATCC 27803] [Faecalitalea cylindroides ATCC 27803]
MEELIMKIVNTQEFNELMNEKAVLVDFFATWCGPCKMLSPVLEGVAEKMKDKVTIVKVDVDRSPDLAAKFGVMSVPTMIMFKNGRQVDAFSGYMPEANLMANIERNL